MTALDTADLAIGFDDVLLAAERLRGVAHRTPVVTSRSLDALTGAQIFLKCENLQRMGAFKFRGAYNRLAQLSDGEKRRGVVAFSSGNHAQGVALAAQILGVPATIVMPTNAPAAKVAATRGYGAEIVSYDPYTNADRAELARRVAEGKGATLVPPFDDPCIIAGQGTAGLELAQDVPGLDALLVCTGGGGFLSGCTIGALGLQPAIDVWGVEPEAGDDFRQSLALGRRVTIGYPATIADGARTLAPGELTFPIVQRLARGVVTVPDSALSAAMRFAFERLKLVIEPTGALALAAVMTEQIPVRGRRIGVTISGGNVDAQAFAAAIGG